MLVLKLLFCMSNSFGKLLGMHLAPTFCARIYNKNISRYTEIAWGIL